jgi:hypothetical protein
MELTMPSSNVTLLDRLLEGSTTSECKEHVIEQASYAVNDVQQRLMVRFEEIVADIASEFGNPEFNASTQGGESKNPMPSWITGSRQAEIASKVLRLSYWKREQGVSYIILRMELDAKDRPTYYDLVLGGRRRHKTDTPQMSSLRNKDMSFFGWLKRLVGIKG